MYVRYVCVMYRHGGQALVCDCAADEAQADDGSGAAGDLQQGAVAHEGVAQIQPLGINSASLVNHMMATNVTVDDGWMDR